MAGALTFHLQIMNGRAVFALVGEWRLLSAGLEVAAAFCITVSIIATPKDSGFPFPCALLPRRLFSLLLESR